MGFVDIWSAILLLKVIITKLNNSGTELYIFRKRGLNAPGNYLHAFL